MLVYLVCTHAPGAWGHSDPSDCSIVKAKMYATP